MLQASFCKKTTVWVRLWTEQSPHRRLLTCYLRGTHTVKLFTLHNKGNIHGMNKHNYVPHLLILCFYFFSLFFLYFPTHFYLLTVILTFYLKHVILVNLFVCVIACKSVMKCSKDKMMSELFVFWLPVAMLHCSVLSGRFVWQVLSPHLECPECQK